MSHNKAILFFIFVIVFANFRGCRLSNKNIELENQVSELTHQVAELEKEKNFYAEKLKKVGLEISHLRKANEEKRGEHGDIWKQFRR